MKIGQKFSFKIGNEVVCNGFLGLIAKICDGVLDGMVEVRLARGVVCVSASYPDCYPKGSLIR